MIGSKCFNTGTATQTLFDIKFAMACALGCMASKIIVAHNHPGALLQPSAGDISITKKLAEACTLMEIKLVDHLIINREGYYSFAGNGLLKV